jgi:hypothetical protein
MSTTAFALHDDGVLLGVYINAEDAETERQRFLKEQREKEWMHRRSEALHLSPRDEWVEVHIGHANMPHWRALLPFSHSHRVACQLADNDGSFVKMDDTKRTLELLMDKRAMEARIRFSVSNFNSFMPRQLTDDQMTNLGLFGSRHHPRQRPHYGQYGGIRMMLPDRHNCLDLRRGYDRWREQIDMLDLARDPAYEHIDSLSAGQRNIMCSDQQVVVTVTQIHGMQPAH